MNKAPISTPNQQPEMAVEWNNFIRLLDLALHNASKLTRVPINADRWEEVLEATFRKLGYTVNRPGTHMPGVDLVVSKQGSKSINISAKAGTVNATAKTEATLKFSSYRLSHKKNLPLLENKVVYLNCELGEVDWYLFASRNTSQQEKKENLRRYYVYLAKQSMIWQTQLNDWEGDNEKGWTRSQSNGVKLTIKPPTMSYQLWIDVPLRLFGKGLVDLDTSEAGTLLHQCDIEDMINELGKEIDFLFEEKLTRK